MRIAFTKPLFAWDELEDSPSLTTLRELLAALPDGKLLDSLRQARGKGRDDYPVHVLWGVVVLSIACRHLDVEACLAELRRNAGLRRLIGIEQESQVPHGWNMSRFLAVLGESPHRELLHEVFNALIQELGRVVPDLARTPLATPRNSAVESPSNRSLPPKPPPACRSPAVAAKSTPTMRAA
ncbi:MAG: transposase [Planctomycetaceae bacterium]|nr:transposase [Planctomycetaceae bacterium]